MSGLCSPECRSFVGRSSKFKGIALCCSPLYIYENESCLSSLLRECKFFSVQDSDERIEGEVFELDQSSPSERRQFRRLNVFRLVEVKKPDAVHDDFSGAVVDLSQGGMAIIFLKQSYLNITQGKDLSKFDVVLRLNQDSEIQMSCEARRIVPYSNFVQIGATFVEPLAEQLQKLLRLWQES